VITIVRAPPFATVQDLGRTGYLEAAVPASGALDRFSLAVANVLVGNPRGAAGLEWGLGGGTLRFERAAVFALAGAHMRATLSNRAIEIGRVAQAASGDVLEVHRFDRGAWLYIAVAGGIDLPVVLGSRSTYLPGKFGGLEGRVIRSGDRLPIGAAPARAEKACDAFRLPSEVADDPVIGILPGPDQDAFETGDWDRFVTAEYKVSRVTSRMGYRLEAGAPPPSVVQNRPSAPACIGTVQLPAGGQPIVLLADGPTVGGYARIGVVATADIGRLAQRRPGDSVRFRPTELETAVQALKQQTAVLDRLEQGA
jgi:antagonist of KipI